MLEGAVIERLHNVAVATTGLADALKVELLIERQGVRGELYAQGVGQARNPGGRHLDDLLHDFGHFLGLLHHHGLFDRLLHSLLHDDGLFDHLRGGLATGRHHGARRSSSGD